MKYGQIKTGITLPFSSLKDLDEYIESIINKREKPNITNDFHDKKKKKDK
jgi:hypothetical protein